MVLVPYRVWLVVGRLAGHLLGVIAGAGIGFGWLPSLLMLPFAATFASRVTSGRDAAAYGAFAGIGLLYGVVLPAASRHPKSSRANGCRPRLLPPWLA